MKRIAIFHPVDDSYGASKILAYVIGFLSKKYICDVYIPQDNKVISGVIKNNHNVNFYEIPYLPVIHRGMYTFKGILKWLFMNIKLFFLMRKLKAQYDLIYINTLALFSVVVISKILGIKSLVHCHEYLKGSLYGRLIKKTVQQCATVIISVSNHVATYISDGKSNGYVIHNGIPDLSIKKADPLKNGFINFAMVGRVMPEKGQWFLLEALKVMPKNNLAKIKVHVYGDAPPTRKELMSKFIEDIEVAGLNNNIIVYGFDSAASEKIQQLDCCLVPSLMPDPFPTTVLEAMRASKIVIATNHGGAKEVIDSGVNGFTINQNDVEQFSLVLSNIACMSDIERELMGQNARVTYCNEYTIEQFEKRFINTLSLYL
ncbi:MULTISPECIES: glycosyltransferase family 4 protein [Citrobacter freundii complex]|uniref:glycosyltransferase family 4 protein n=1 Tax=Citrobacter freundii complex TaxID=1344959 RepID=UPI000D743062|nr:MULTISPECIES: glycosyltransferase family 4 protein [Citrobacter freundii complex]ELQ7796092.1 glycosyltransferase family 4 protein [Citrobacter freundii]MBE0095737.1 glycosyltransferase family 4 protein [Citrobacter freundii]MBJ9515926.1 glycosyltransferase family 4 protein [Citrobacter freundii]MDV0558041.1 glycosyltransferase family 4 protein [Citrobacter portucalensis]MDV0583247.1 glycosyltransferase family 4 protein [Citrobacter portucalensis]